MGVQPRHENTATHTKTYTGGTWRFGDTIRYERKSLTIPDPQMLAPFVAATLALTLTPGLAVLYIVTRGAEGGRPAGVASALGIGTNNPG